MLVRISIDGIPPIEGQIDETDTKTFFAFKDALPISGKVSRWGDEIYFYVDFNAPLEKGARARMDIGEIAYWPNGPALAIFFGPTPASEGGEPMAASECNVIGRISADPETLRKARNGSTIRIDVKI